MPDRLSDEYSPGLTAASKSVLLEIMTALRAYQNALILVGGWVPYLLLEKYRLSDNPFVHVGSIDIDVAVDPTKISDQQYATIVELLKERGYRPAPDRQGDPIPYVFEREVVSSADKRPYKIRVDFLTHQEDPRTGQHRHLPVQDDLLARKTKGCEAAFKHKTTFDLTGTLPEGGQITVPIQMADVVGCLTMKGIVLGERYREKDAYDIYALIANYQKGPRDVADALRPHLSIPLVKEAVSRIHTAFATRETNGPAWVATFLQANSQAEKDRLVTDAFMTVHEFDVLLFNPEAGIGEKQDTPIRPFADLFRQKWDSLSPDTRLVVAALFDEGGVNVKKETVKIGLRERYGMDKEKVHSAMQWALTEFIRTDLVKLIANSYSGDELSVNPTWREHLVGVINESRRSAKE